jgi:hypothetical protein
MKEINGAITILVNENKVTIQVEDKNAVCKFLDIELTTEQFCLALGRLINVPIKKCVVRGLDIVGKKREHKDLVVELPEGTRYRDKEVAKIEIDKNIPEGWTTDYYLDSQDSFFKKDGKSFAKCLIKRWVDNED